MNPALSYLQPYPFEKLAQLKQQVTPPSTPPILLSVGEPKHQAPDFILNALHQHRAEIAKYPITKGLKSLRESCSQWLCQRFQLTPSSLDPEHNILPVNGTREALFAFAQCVVNPSDNPLVLMPNPFYQIYEGAALLAGAEPWFLNTTADNHFLPDFESVPDHVWQRCQLIYVCSPGNPTGAVIDHQAWQYLLEKSEQYQFIIAADECYSEIYPDENNPPSSLLTAAKNFGLENYQRCIVFHSLSKRSNIPGLRSGFVAGDATLIKAFTLYRTYHGCAMPYHHQYASILAWNDEAHVKINRDLYRQKFSAVKAILEPILTLNHPDAGFYFWPQTPISDTEFAKRLYAAHNVTVLPGSYLSRTAHGINPGQNYIRIALVPPLDECITAAKAMQQVIEQL